MKNAKHKFPVIRLSSIPIRILKSKLFLRNFFFLWGILCVIFLIFAISLFAQTRNTLKNEFTAASQYQLEETVVNVDQHIMDMQYIIATLDTNNIVQAFFTYEKPESIYDDYEDKLQEILKAYVYGFPSIHSIYLYSQDSDTIISSLEVKSTSHFQDIGWMEKIEEGREGFTIYMRRINGSFPYVLTVMKQLKFGDHEAAVIVNLDLSKLPQLVKVSSDSYHTIYIVSDDKQIIFRNGQEALTEPLDVVPELINYQPDADFYTQLIDKDDPPYIFMQQNSARYPWSYVLITQLHEYSSRLSNSTAIFISVGFTLFCAVFLLSFLLSLRAVKPTLDLLYLLEGSDQAISQEIYTNKEIEYIANKITWYIQENKALSDELSARLDLLNQTRLLALQSQINPHFLFNTLNMIHIRECEALGYDHEIPKLTLDLSRLLRHSIEGTDLSPLEAELGYTKQYIHILQNRFDGNPQVIFDIDETTLNAKVPKLFIQPIVENAVFHGFSENMNENSILTISCQRDSDFCVLLVRDNGCGMTTEKVEQLKDTLKENVPLKYNIGIKNVVTRMNLLYGEDFHMEIKSTPGVGTEFLFRFPI